MSGEIAPILDHVVVNARDALEPTAALYRRLGFFLTAPSRHTLGSVNHTAVFARDYLELVGVDAEAAAPRAELLRSPLGLEGLVFATPDADELYRKLRDRGAPVLPPVAFSRPVALDEGVAEARFRVVRVAAERVPFGRCYFCQHLTPDLVWREAWRAHPNGAQGIARVVIAATDPEALRALFRALFGEAAGSAPIEIVPAARDALAEVAFRVRSLGETRSALAAGAVAARIEPRRIVVPPEAAMGARLVFAEDDG